MNNDAANEQTSSSHITQGQIEVASHSDLTYSHHYRVCGTPTNIKYMPSMKTTFITWNITRSNQGQLVMKHIYVTTFQQVNLGGL